MHSLHSDLIISIKSLDVKISQLIIATAMKKLR